MKLFKTLVHTDANASVFDKDEKDTKTFYQRTYHYRGLIVSPGDGL